MVKIKVTVRFYDETVVEKQWEEPIEGDTFADIPTCTWACTQELRYGWQHGVQQLDHKSVG